jgi:MarR family transcriptional regulator, multiple antibiotic resistance protein MarR
MAEALKTAPQAEIYDAKSYEPGKGLGHLMGRLRGEMLAALDRELAADEHLAALEVTAAQLIIIASLAASGAEAKSASALCKGISYDAGAMTRMVDRLENKGLIRRERCPNDRRLVYLELTDEGRAAYPKMREISRRVLNHFLRGFSAAEARLLESMLRRMLDNA